MVKLLGIVSLVLALLLFPPATLAVLSNNAVPGDRTYPIKRGLEDVIYAAASLNPITKAWFAKARSDRRFQEITILLNQGKEANETLGELVTQTQAAADQIDQVSDLAQKQKLIRQLSDSITKYDQGLSQRSSTKPAPKPVVTPPSTSLSTPRPTPLVSPPPAPVPDPELQRALEELERIRKRLEELERQSQMMSNQNPIPNPTSTPTPKPTSKPAPTAIPIATPRSTNRPLQQNFDTQNQTPEEPNLNVDSAGELLRKRQASGSSVDITPAPTASSSGSVQGISASWPNVFSELFSKIQSLLW